MKGPGYFDNCNPHDQQLEHLTKRLEEHFANGHDEANLAVDGLGGSMEYEVFERLAKDASDAGWDVRLHGAQLTIKKPSKL
jgi:hypothetical protein